MSDAADDTGPRHTPHGDRDDNTTGDYWWFYCYRCEQWCERAGPLCDLYRPEPLTSPCIFDENPGWSRGVLRTEDPDLVRQFPF